MAIDLRGKLGLVVGVANADSLTRAAVCEAHAAGAGLALTYLNEKAKPFAAPLAEQVQALFLPGDVRKPGELEAVFDAIRTRATSGIEHFHELVAETERRSAERRSVSAEEVGRAALVLVRDLASGVTGEVVHVDVHFHGRRHGVLSSASCATRRRLKWNG